MENKVLELIKLHTGNLQRNKQTELSLENEQLKLAQEIVKLFSIPAVVGRSESFVCGHPPKQTYLNEGTWHCEKCGGKWESIANK